MLFAWILFAAMFGGAEKVSAGDYNYIALTVDPYTGKSALGYGTSTNAASRDAIKNIDSNYWVDPGYTSRCIALALTYRNPNTIKQGYVIQVGDTEREAQNKAYGQCRQSGNDCYGSKSGCAVQFRP